MESRIRVLCVEDDSVTARLLQKKMIRAGYSVDLAGDGSQGLAAYEAGAYDIVTVDQDMPHMTGLELIRALAQRHELPPTVMITGAGNESIAVEAMKLGASDYVIKDPEARYLHLVPSVLQSALEKRRLRDETNKAHQKLRESEERFRSIAETISEVFWMADPQFQSILYVSPGYERLWGRSVDTLYENPQSFLDTVHEDDREMVAASLPVNGDERQFEKEFRIRRPDGEIRWILNRTFSVAKDDGRVSRYVGVASDITDRKKAEEALFESETRYRTLFEASAEGITVADQQTLRIRYANHAICQMLGYTHDELTSLTIRDLHPAERLDTIANAVRSHGPGDRDEVEALPFIKKDGTIIYADTSVAFMEIDGRPCVVGFFRDTTDRRLAQQAATESRERYEAMFEHSPNGIAVYEPVKEGSDFVFLEFNPAAELISRIKKEEVVGRSLLEIFPNVLQTGLVSALQRVFQTGVSEHLPYFYYEDGQREGWRDNVVYKIPSGNVVAIYNDVTERKKAKAALEASEAKYRTLVENIPDVAWTTDFKGHTSFISPNVEAICGYSPREVYEQGGKLWSETIHPDDLVRVRRAFVALFKTGERYDVEYRMKRKDGAWIWVHNRAVATYRKEGNMVADGLFTDITERKNAETALRDSEQVLKSILLATPVGLCLTEDSVIKWANEAWEKMFGFEERSQYAGLPTDILYELKETYARARQKAYTGLDRGNLGETYSEFKRKDGSSFRGYLRSTLLEPSDPSKGTVSAIADVTEIEKAEQARLESERRYKALFSDSRDAVFVTSRDGTVIDANQSFCDIFGYDLNELVRFNAAEGYLEPDERKAFQEAIEKTGSIKDFPVRFRKKNGLGFDALVTATVFYGERDEILGYQGIVRDVSDRKRLEQQLFQAQKMESIGTLAGGIAHDFNNLLQVILGFSNMMIFDKKPTDNDYEGLHAIRQAARSGADLAKRILAFSRKLESNARPVNLNNEIRRVEKILRRTIPKMIQIELALADDLMTIIADPGQMEQVLLNLVTNSQHAMPEGGRLTIETANVTLNGALPGAHPGLEPGRYVVITVSDTGHGMDEDVLEHIFEPFYTTKAPGEGTGLGLSIVYGIIKNHKGHVFCQSAPGAGTSFHIYFPAIVLRVETDAAVNRQLPVSGTETVLLVDDERPIRQIVKQFLGKGGYTVLTAANGREALETYDANKDKIAVVLLDLIMPEMGGRQCLEGLLKIDPKLKVIVASGYSAQGPDKVAVEAGARAFINKPYEAGALLRIVRKVLDEK